MASTFSSVQRPSTPQRRGTEPIPTIMDASLEITGLILTTLQDAAQFAPIPYLKDSAGLALGLLNIVETAKDNKEEFKRLASDACGLVYATLCTHQEAQLKGEQVSKKLLENVQELLDTLYSIEKFAHKETRRGKFARVLRHQSDIGKIKEYREKLRQSLDIFGLQSNITIREGILRIAAQQQEIIDDMRDRKERETEMEKNKEQEEKQKKEFSTQDKKQRELEKENHQEDEPLPSPTPSFLSPSAPGKSRLPLGSPTGSFTVTRIGGDKTETDNSVMTNNTNSGNTTNTTISGSYNDSSVRYGGGPRRRAPKR